MQECGPPLPQRSLGSGGSAAGLLGLETTFGQLFEKQLDHVALDFDHAVLEPAAATAALLQRAGQLLQLGLGQRYAEQRRQVAEVERGRAGRAR